ncbi:MAG TPA: LamG domain-containing protein, partial [Candidatus Woesebacteria bacterium]|nr:LamG domain-containing protein [Candidatus Woesebacteria bacterium]
YGSVANNSGSIGSTGNGTLPSSTSSPTWIENGKIYKGLHFDNNDYISLPNSLGYTNQVSAFTWFKSNGTPAGSYHIVMGGQELEISIPTSGQIRTGVYTNTRYVSNHGSGLVDGQWHHIGFTFDGSTKKSYIDGRFVGEQTGISGTLVSSFAGRRIGQFGTNATYFLNGYLDEVKIYDYALSQDEIKREYNQGSSVVFSVDKLSVGSTSTSSLYCIPGSTDPCSPPIAEWNFEESVGTSAFDTSVSGNHGSLTGTSLSTGKIGQALKFKSSNNSYFISSSDPGTMSSGTYSLWVKASNINASMGWIDSNFDIFQWTGNLLYFRAGNQSSVSISNWTPDTWHHLTLTWNGSNYYGYIDGNQVTSGVQSGSRSGMINLGRVDNNYYFDGSIDQVRVYNYARTPAQIAWDYNQGAPIGWWKMDECTGTNIKDWSFNSKTGTASIGAAGSQTSVGTCTTPGTAWGIGSTGKFNSSLSLDGTDDYVTIPQYNLSNNSSISAWIKGSYTNGNQIIAGSKDSIAIGLYNSSGYKIIGYASSNGTYKAVGVADNIFINNSWNHLVVTFNSLGNPSYYCNGELLTTSGTNYWTWTDNTAYIGRRTSGTYFKGQVDDVRIYNYPLTPEQIKIIYNGGAINFD